MYCHCIYYSSLGTFEVFKYSKFRPSGFRTLFTVKCTKEQYYVGINVSSFTSSIVVKHSQQTAGSQHETKYIDSWIQTYIAMYLSTSAGTGNTHHAIIMSRDL